jgi:hypothetical protein
MRIGISHGPGLTLPEEEKHLGHRAKNPAGQGGLALSGRVFGSMAKMLFFFR